MRAAPISASLRGTPFTSLVSRPMLTSDTQSAGGFCSSENAHNPILALSG